MYGDPVGACAMTAIRGLFLSGSHALGERVTVSRASAMVRAARDRQADPSVRPKLRENIVRPTILR
jgi:hypothetical protein